MSKYTIIFDDGDYIEHLESSFYSWPTSAQSNLLYLYDEKRKPIGRFNIKHVAAIYNEEFENDNLGDQIIFSNIRKYTFLTSGEDGTWELYSDSHDYNSELNTIDLRRDNQIDATINLNTAYGYYVEDLQTNE